MGKGSGGILGVVSSPFRRYFNARFEAVVAQSTAARASAQAAAEEVAALRVAVQALEAAVASRARLDAEHHEQVVTSMTVLARSIREVALEASDPPVVQRPEDV